MAPLKQLSELFTRLQKSEVRYIFISMMQKQSVSATCKNLFLFTNSDIVDKTAVFVARNGLEFEARIHKNEQSNPKFNFLKPGDPYHAYYQYKVKEMKEGKPGDAPAAPLSGNISAPPPPPKAQSTPAPVNVPAPTAQHLKQQEILKQFQQEIPQIPKEPPPDFEFIVDPPSISAMEL